MRLEVDQSVKIEQSGDSVLAVSNDDWEAVVITGRVKTKLQNFLREQKLGRRWNIEVFSVGLYLLLRSRLSQSGKIIIDQEYPDKQFIMDNVLKLSKFDGVKIKPTILFSLIGRNSSAHKIAKLVKRNKKTGKRLSFSEIQIQLARLIERPPKKSG